MPDIVFRGDKEMAGKAIFAAIEEGATVTSIDVVEQGQYRIWFRFKESDRQRIKAALRNVA